MSSGFELPSEVTTLTAEADSQRSILNCLELIAAKIKKPLLGAGCRCQRDAA